MFDYVRCLAYLPDPDSEEGYKKYTDVKFQTKDFCDIYGNDPWLGSLSTIIIHETLTRHEDNTISIEWTDDEEFFKEEYQSRFDEKYNYEFVFHGYYNNKLIAFLAIVKDKKVRWIYKIDPMHVYPFHIILSTATVMASPKDVAIQVLLNNKYMDCRGA